MPRSKHVVASRDVPRVEQTHGEHYAVVRQQLGAAAGGQKIGTSLYEIPPGKRGWPMHYHLANEEAIYVLEGDGTLRIGSDVVAVQAGDYVALPVGPACAHQLMNTSERPLRYLAISTMIEPDIMGYPDSGKFGGVGGAAPGGPKEQRTFSQFWPGKVSVDYWEGEENPVLVRKPPSET